MQGKNEKSFNINWYPGHMAKTKKEIADDLKLVDIVIEILDSRIPISSQNPDVLELIKNKPRIIVLNKSDLADEEQSKLWVNYFRKHGISAILTNCETGSGIKEVITEIENLNIEKMENDINKGRTGRKVKAIVLRYTKCRKIFFYK